MPGAMDLGVADYSQCAGHEQAAQIAVALFADTPSRSFPPLECCFGTNTIQAEKLRPDRKVLGSATFATRAVASIHSSDGFTNCLCVSHIVLLPFDVGLHVSWR